MAFLENPFALLNDTDGDDTELFAPLAAKAEKNPGEKRNNNQEKRRPSAAPDKSRTTSVPPPPGRSENGRGGMGRGSGRHNGNGFDRLDNRQNGAPQSNNVQSNGNRRHNEQADVNKQYGGDGDVYRQNRQGNGYRKVNRQSDTHEQNNDRGYRHYRRGSGSAGYLENGSKQQGWRLRGADGRESKKINGSGDEDQILEANQQVNSQGQEKLAEGNSFKGDVHQVRNGGWNFYGDRRGSGGRRGPQGNGDSEDQFSSGLGGMNRGKGDVSVHKAKESLNGEPRDSDNKNATIEGEETTEVSNNADPRQRNHERINKRNQSENPIKQEKKVHNMTLEEYEKQLIEKRKALEALKPQERKVTLDKDFELMQLVGRKKEDFATKLNSEKDNLEEKESLEKVQLKKVERPEQHEKVRKSMSMDVFLKVFKRSDRVREGRRGYWRDFERDGLGRGRGHGDEHEERGRYRGGYSRNGVEAAPNAGKSIGPSQARKINIQDSEHFPGLSAVAKA